LIFDVGVGIVTSWRRVQQLTMSSFYTTPPPTPPRKVKSFVKEEYYRNSVGPMGVRMATIASTVSVLIWGWITFEYSSEKNANYYRYVRKLSSGWIFGRMIDNSDSQYSSFRNNVPVLALVLVVHQIMTLLLRKIFKNPNDSLDSNWANWRMVWNLTTATIFLFSLFGASLVKVWILVSIHYLIMKSVKSIASPIFSWVFGIGILFLNHAFQGYKFGVIPGLAWLDMVNGIGMRWQISFNFCVLRMISFSMDYYWMRQSLLQFDSQLEGDVIHEVTELSEKSRIEKHLSACDYNYFSYMCYLTYAPLYLAGPIISFNNYMEQIRRTPKTISFRSTAVYAVRWLGIVLLMEIMMHLFHVVAIKDTRAWEGFSSLQIFTLGYFNLNLIWLKVLIKFILAYNYLEVFSTMGIS
jgi:protein-cysteine N-palmitoyltransferase HHAT